MLALATAFLTVAPASDSTTILRSERSSPGDLEVGGELAGLPAGSTRYVRYEDLLQLPQETYTVSDDTNFHGKTGIGGVALSTLAQILGHSADMIVAICYDHYRTNYPADYLAAHHPLLVLRINGQEREHWPAADNGGSMGPYLISHPMFKPSFKVLSHEDEPQIPYGVTRIEFRREAEVFGAIRPAGRLARRLAGGAGICDCTPGLFSLPQHGRGRRYAWPATHGWNWRGSPIPIPRASAIPFAIPHRYGREQRCPRTATTTMPRWMR